MIKLATKRPVDWNASVYYRTLVPAINLAKNGLAEVFVDDGSRELDIETVAMAASHSDVFQDYQRVDEGWEQIATVNRSRPSYWRSDKTWGCAPIMVMDTDDDLFNVLPLNPAFVKLGYHVNGKAIPDGQFVGVEVATGKKAILHQDGKNGFDLKRNRATVEQFRRNLIVSDLVTCSTPRSRDYVLREVPGANTVVIPNCIDFNDYPEVDLREHEDNELTVLWQGSPTHHEDLYPLRTQFGEIAKKYPFVRWLFWGAQYKWIMDVLPADKVTYIPWCQYVEYKLRLSTLNFDINLAPLHPAPFNQSRSAIKVYEAAALTRPVMSIAQRTGAFADELVDGETALLFETPEEFGQQLEKAINDKWLRKRIAGNMKQWLKDNRDPVVWAKVLGARLEELVNKRKDLIGPPLESFDDLSNKQPDVRGCEDAGDGGGGKAANGGDEGSGGASDPVCDPSVESAKLEVGSARNDISCNSGDRAVPTSV